MYRWVMRLAFLPAHREQVEQPAMKMSRRAKRMEMHHKRHKGGGFNLVSLMDIFTILVFFLLVNSSTVDQLPNSKTVKLPQSISEKKPDEMLVVLVNDTDIIIADRKVASVADVIDTEETIIPGLKEELDYQAGKAGRRLVATDEFIGEIMIVGDKEVPYKLLKKIMVTCAQANYSQIFLAVQQKANKREAT